MMAGKEVCMPEHTLGRPSLLRSKSWLDSCDNCYCQGLGKHYCDLHGVTVKDMDVTCCPDWQTTPPKESNAELHSSECREQKFAEIAAENRTLCKQLQYANGKLSEAMLKMDELRTMLCKPND